MNAETFNGLMQQVSRLTLRQRALLRKRLDEVDGQAQGFAVIESQSVTEPRSCPHCQGTSLYLHGQVNGLQRYRCQACRRTFNALTGTALARLRKKDKWLGFSGALVASQPFRPAAATLGVHRNTALRDRTRGLVGHKTNADSWRLHALPETYHGQRPFDGRAKKGPCVACDGTERRSGAISKIKWTTIVKPIMVACLQGWRLASFDWPMVESHESCPKFTGLVFFKHITFRTASMRSFSSIACCDPPKTLSSA